MAVQQQPGGQPDNSAGILWMIAAVFVAIGAVWVFFKKHIVIVYLSIKLYELEMLDHFFPSLELDQLHVDILSALANPTAIHFDALLLLGAGVGDWLKIPFAILLCLLAVVVYSSNTTRAFKRSYSMKELVKLEKDNWPQISPVADLDLIKVDIDAGPWAMAMTPMQFCKKNGLLIEMRGRRTEGMSRKDWDKTEVVLKRGEASKLFALQLGALWGGVDKLPTHLRVLFAVFAARINADTAPAEKLLVQLAASSLNNLNTSGVDALIKKHGNTELVRKIIRSHAYVLTVMASMLEGAREDGVQASADFLWLKPVDRRAWYILNTVGRQTPFVEVAGIFAHWIAEKEAGRKLIAPIVGEATNALELALKEVVYHPDTAVVTPSKGR